jgi:protoporphyrinogen/coproporphyrinogen III oxidase
LRRESERDAVDTEADVLVLGGGIAGVAAALRLQDRGLTPLVLERENRVGGRMTTDRIKGFAIDRGVTLLGNQFTRMRALCRRFGLKPRMKPAPFSLGLNDGNTVHGLRAGRPDDILRSSLLSPRAKTAFLRLTAELVCRAPNLSHGESYRALSLDTIAASDYFRSLGPGGEELFEGMFMPGLRGPLGGAPREMSRAPLMQVIWNILVRGTWNLAGGVDGVPEAIAGQVPVRTGCWVTAVCREGAGVRVETAGEDGAPTTYHARAAIFATPGHLIPPLCPDLPGWLTEPLHRTEYAPMVSAHVAVSRPPDTPYPGISFSKGVENGVEIEMEHLRAPENHPAGQGVISLYFYPDRTAGYQTMDDETLRSAAVALVERWFPECTGKTLFVHVIRWQSGIARFPPGRMTEMVRLRERLRTFDQPFDFCGDCWDGIGSEAALRTGEQAADRLLYRFSHA